MANFLRKLLTPFPLLTLAASMVTLWITGIWWIVLLGLLAAGIITVQSVLSEGQDAIDAPQSDSFELAPLHPQLKIKFRSILEEKDRIIKELRECGEDTFLKPEEISAQVNELVASYYDLLLKIEKIRPFIDQGSVSAVKRSIEELRAQIGSCSDDVTRENLALALKNKTDQLGSLNELTRYKDRVESQLINLLSTLNSLYVRIVQLKISPDSSADPTSEIKESIDNMLLDVQISEKISREFHRILNGNAV